MGWIVDWITELNYWTVHEQLNCAKLGHMLEAYVAAR